MTHLYVSRPWWKRLGDWFYGYSTYLPATTSEKVYGVALAVVLGIAAAVLVAHWSN